MDGHFHSQSIFDSQTFLDSQTYLLKRLLRDKGGEGVAGCKMAVMRHWLLGQQDAGDWLEAQFRALVRGYEDLLAEPRPANLKRVKARGKPPQLVWRVPNEQGSQVVIALFAPDQPDAQAVLARLPQPVVTALMEIESWRLVLNYLASLQQWVTSSGQECLDQVEALRQRRKLFSHENSIPPASQATVDQLAGVCGD